MTISPGLFVVAQYLMLRALTSFALMLIAAPLARADAVRIGLFSLFKPEAIEVRIVGSGKAVLETNRIDGSRQLAAGSHLRLQLSSGRLNVTVSDASGNIRQSFASGEIRIHISDAMTLVLILPGKLSRTVRGDLLIAADRQNARGTLKIVMTTDREAAVTSIVAAETEARTPEALKALAVVVRTYMLSHPNRHAGEGFDFCDTTHCQFYRGEADLAAGPAASTVRNAVAATAGEYLRYEGKPLEAYFTAVCGGLTATPQMVWGGVCEYPYQRLRCNWCRASSHYAWTRQADAGAVFNALAAALGSPLSRATDLSVESDDASGFVRAVIIRDRGRESRMSADEFRRAIGRRLGWATVLSPSFSVERHGGQVIFRGKGFGSQIGLCLAGAVAQARAGRHYDEILRFYFPRAEIASRVQSE